MRSIYQQYVHAFRKAAQQHQAESAFEVVPQEAKELAARLILEEALETIRALGYTAIVQNNHEVSFENYITAVSVTDVVDGCCDLIYVALGCLDTFGVHDHAAMIEVCENNHSKVKFGHIDEHGKLRKPSGHLPPDLYDAIYNPM